jgi:hypothetical protein
MKQLLLTTTTLLLLNIQLLYGSSQNCHKFKSGQCQNSNPTTITLFMDMNGGPREVNCAHKAACKTNQLMLVFPSKELKKQIHHYRKNMSMPKDFMKNALKEFLADSKKKHDLPVENIVISGHDGGSRFGSNNGTINFSEVNEVFDQLKLKDDVKSVFSWGCYTATLGEIDNKWAQNFPKLNFLLGYDLKAPLSDKPGSYETLYDGLVETRKIIDEDRQNEQGPMTSSEDKSQAETSITLQDVVDALTHKNILDIAGYYHPQNSFCAMDARSYFGSVLSNKDAIPLSEAMKKCQELEQQFEQRGLAQRILNYQNGEAPFNEADIREIYNLVRTIESCSSESGHIADNLILMIYDKFIYPTFFRVYGKDMERIKQALINYFGISAEEAEKYIPTLKDFKNNPSNYRKTIAQKIHKLDGLLQEEQKRVSPLPPKCLDGSVDLYEDKDCVKADVTMERIFKEKSGDLGMGDIQFASFITNSVLIESSASVIPTSWRDDRNSRDQISVLSDMNGLFFE